MKSALFAAAASVGMIFGVASQGHADTVDFSNETVEWTVPFSEGGGTDTAARFLAPIFSRHLPGEPNVVVRNVPGGGSITGANMFAARARPDGLTILHTGGSTVMPYLLQDPRAEYDYRQFEPVMALSTGAVVYIQPDLGVSEPSEIQNLKDQELVIGSQGVASLDLVALWAFRLLDLDVRPVFGMEGSGPKRLAFQRGESTIDMQTAPGYIANVQPLEERGEVVPLWAWGIFDDDGKLIRDPSFPDLPHFAEVYEFMHGAPPEGEDFEIMKALIAAGYQAEKFIFLPEGTPDDIVEAWRAAARAVVEDPEFQESREEVLGSYPQVLAPQIENVLRVATSIDDDARRRVTEWLSDEFDYRP